jgi:lysophospholipase L1-like esterase
MTMKKFRSSRRGAVAGLLVALVFALLWGAKRWCGPPFFSRHPMKDLALIHYIGRFDAREAGGSRSARFAWPGSAIAATFDGTGIDVALRDAGTNFFSVVVDGLEATTLSTNGAKETYTLASGLVPGRHSVILTKRTESFVGIVDFRGFSPHDGALVPSPPPFTRRIEYVGDSITCGYGNLGKNATCPFSPDTEDVTSAYGALAGKELGAAVSVIAYSGIGMVRNYSGDTTDQMPVLFERTLPSEPTPWSFAPPEPDVVVINLGTNDFAKGDPGPPFERAYAGFLRQLRGHYPRTFVVSTLSPMLSDSDAGTGARTTARTAIVDAVEQQRAAGDTRVSYFAFDPTRPNDGFGCDYHPSAATHRAMAAALVKAIRAVAGW